MPTSDPVITEVKDCVPVITINRPEAKNAPDRSAAMQVAAAGRLLRLPKAASSSRAMLLALTGEPITAADAEHDIVTVLTEPGHAISEACKIAASIAANGPLAVRATKQISRLDAALSS